MENKKIARQMKKTKVVDLFQDSMREFSFFEQSQFKILK